jgi:branched-chain amino acid transport system permease protein
MNNVAQPGAGRPLLVPTKSVLLPLAVVVSAAVILMFVPIWFGGYGAEIGFTFLIYVTLAEAWNLLAGYGGLVSLGSAAFIGTGAYVLVGLLNHTAISVPMALVIAGAAPGLLAAIVSPTVFRLRGLYFTVGTLALGEAARLFMINVPFFGGAAGPFLKDIPPSTAALYPYGIALFALATFGMSLSTRTRLSIILRSVREDEDAASQMGVRAFRVKFVAFTVASFIMGTAGGLEALKLGAIEPYGMFGLQWSVNVFAIVIIGGLGQRAGATVGSIFIISINELLADYPEIHTAITGLILIIVIRFAPRGLCGLAEDLLRRVRVVIDPGVSTSAADGS